ncbi:winged helix-turn-helix domain-containing protein [Arthrobacter roseus]|uniref:winged helix-turn-helix domain-containing protein n=1 Tax=Arthrobacter roseus TaxID=136274 RepID=UPI001965A396|nr:winged helix-turn-helix domain-containing protein [Arthrobacter roseus]MBM7847619.1 DNA-binding winged helix-turn-helix (wHTH) protein [Arthrobacter roseus]
MSVASGYVHISLRPQRRDNSPSFQHSRSAEAYSEGQGYRQLHAVPPYGDTAHPETAPTPVITPNGVPGPQPVSSDTAARGFVVYVGLDEEAATANGTTLTKLAQNIRAYVQELVPGAQSHAAVALAPAGAQGADIDVVRRALGDPTANRRPRAEARNHASGQRATGVLIDLARREVQLDGDILNLTFKEFELLNYLVENGTRTVSREELLESLWKNAEEVPNVRTIDVHIRRLRAKLSRLANTVRTVRGQGYRFYEHPEVVVWAAPEYSI